MHDYLLSSEWIRFAFMCGVAVSMVLYEKRHLTTGSIVVPGYIAVFIIHPSVIIATFVNAFVTYWLVNHFLRRYFMLYGRTKFTVLALIATSIQIVMLKLSPSGPWLWETDVPLFIGVGYVVPALIAHDMARQGVGKTTKSVLLAGSIVAVPIALALALDLPGVNDLAPVSGFGELAIDVKWLPFAVLLSVGASWAVAYNYRLRSGGFVGAAFTSMFVADPWQLVAAASVALITYLVVAKFLVNHMILFGRRKFASMLLVSSAVAWSSLWVGGQFLDAAWRGHLGVGSMALIPLVLPGLIANDSQRTSPQRVVLGLTMAGSFVLTATWSTQSVVIGKVVDPVWKALAAASFVVLFAPQIRAIGILLFGRIRSALPTRSRYSVQPVLAGADAHEDASWVTPWEVWSRRHPNVARDAEAWLDAQVGRFAGGMVPVLATPQAGEFDFTAISVLRAALEGKRGAWHANRSTAHHGEPEGQSSRRSPETSGPIREAQLLAPDVSGLPHHRVADASDDSEHVWLGTRPYVDFG